MSDYDMRQDLVRTRERLTLAEQEVASLRQRNNEDNDIIARLREALETIETSPVAPLWVQAIARNALKETT